ncbi:MAG: transposase [Candidatus Omnitrophica bacterium]|nr:transposase [Candidatus Omnitrophota bacterium]
MRRKDKLSVGEVYHVFNKSIADFKIFNNETEFLRMKYMIKYYQRGMPRDCFARFMEYEKVIKSGFYNAFASIKHDRGKLVDIIAFCLMPSHLHLILRQVRENGISIFVGNLLNSYSRYFNLKHCRKGPLWEGRFKDVLVNRDEYLLHLTRYLHLNPVTSYLVERPDQWQHSSFLEFLSKTNEEEAICQFGDILSIEPTAYKKFVEDRIAYQRELAKIKDLILE